MAGSDAGLRRKMVEFGDALGRAYQVYDGVLDVTGTAEELGKTPGKDARAGKTTFVSLLGLEGAQIRAAEECGRALAALDGFGDEGRIVAAYRALLRDAGEINGLTCYQRKRGGNGPDYA